MSTSLSQAPILVAEDNEINRDVIQAQLRLLGYASEAAPDGVRALAMWRKRRYAMLLTDCRMPHMDGFALTAAIRQAEPAGCRLPIVAFTANASQTIEQQCQTRGMDACLPKPIRMQALAQLLEHWLAPPRAHHTLDKPLSGQAASTQPEWDHTLLRQSVGDDTTMHQHLLEKFLMNARTQVNAIEVALARAHFREAADVAHPLKSSARMVGALHLGNLCEALETAADINDSPQCTALLLPLTDAFLRVSDSIRAHIAVTAPAPDHTLTMTRSTSCP
jgi:CheY-like chemotaxis protein/HPt (histidine-containing phosphotransfer) domain-containing protein